MTATRPTSPEFPAPVRGWKALLALMASDPLDRSANGNTGRAVRKVALACILVELGFAGLHSAMGLGLFLAFDAVAILILGVVAAIALRLPTLALYSAATLCLIHVGALSWQLGRIDNGVAIWILVPSLAATIIGMRRMAVYSATLGLATLIAVDAAARMGWLRPQIALPDPNLLMGGSITLLLGLCAYVAWIVQRARQSLVEKVRAKNAALASAFGAGPPGPGTGRTSR